MKPATMNLDIKALTRRTLLGATALAGAISYIAPTRVLARIADSKSSGGNRGDAQALSPNSANLYAFPGLQPQTSVIAATWPVRLNRLDWSKQNESQVTIHAGSQKWNVTLPGDAMDARLFEQSGCRVFTGHVVTQPGTDRVVLKAVVVELPQKLLLGSGPIDIWAERLMHTGLRQRIGSPFVAALVAEDAELSNSYHRLSPSDDRALLTEDMVKAMAAKARNSGTSSDPNAHGRRLASLLLPDVLHYDPTMPSGFTFAAQNGRHPEDASDVVVDTILSGSPASGSARSAVRLEKSFPFFSQHESVA